MNKISAAGVAAIALFLLGPGLPLASAQTASDLDCEKCVGRDDIAQRTITTGKLKNGAVREQKLGRDVRDRFDEIESRFEYVAFPGAIMQPASSSSSVSYNARGSARPLQQGDTFLMGPIQLPHGMTIQSLACKLRDADDAGRIYVGLRRFSLSESDPADNGDTIVSVTSFSVGSSDDYVVLQRDADSQTSIVDNANYQYHLRVDMLDLAGTPQNLELAGCRVQLGKAPE